MGSVPSVLRSRWRSRLLVGDAKHQLVVRVRRGYMNRCYQPMEMLDGSGRPVGLPVIWKGLNMNPWQGQWTVEGDWITLTEVQSAKATRDTQTDNGSSTLTVVMDDIAFLDTEGTAGLYHTIQRGYFSPQRGIRVAGRPDLYSRNAWADVLNGGYQIETWEGYGPDAAPAMVTAGQAPALPLTIVTGENNTFLYTPEGGPATFFTIAPGTYATLAGLVAAVNAAVAASGELAGNPFATYVTAGPSGDALRLTGTSVHSAVNGDTVSEAAVLGFIGTVVFSGGNQSVTPLDVAVAQTIDGKSVMSCAPPSSAIARTWVGIIDSCEIDSNPDMITITARDFGIFATDQRLIYRVKAPEIPAPVTFADRRTVLGEKPAGYAAAASGTQAGYQPAGVLVSETDEGGWVSDSQAAKSDVVWVEVKLPAGSYDELYLATEAPGQECWVAVQAVGDCRWNGAVITPGWVTTGNAIPGAGHDSVNHYKTVATGGKRLKLGGELQCSEGTVLRVYLSNLNGNIFDSAGDQIAVPGCVGNVFRLWAYRYGTTPSVATAAGNVEGWVLIDDVADIVRCLFVWLGFKEWQVDDFGWSLDQQLNFGSDQFFVDVITAIIAQANYLFFMAAPSDDDMSIGVPCFKKQAAFTRQPRVAASGGDTDLLEALQVSWDLSNLPYSFRVRGAVNRKGVAFGDDPAKRFSGTYFPPWSGIDYRKVSPSKRGSVNDPSERLSGLKRNYVSTEGQVVKLGLSSDAECLFAAVLTAAQYALGEAVGTTQIPGLPGIELNTAVVVVDEASGTNSRLWVTSVESDHTLGPSGAWHMTIVGALLDTEDLNLISEDWAYVLFKYGLGKGSS